MKKILCIFTILILGGISVAKADTNYMCSVIKFVPDTESDDVKDTLTAVKPTLIVVQDKTVTIGKDIFSIVTPKTVGLNLATLTGFNYFSNRRLYEYPSKSNEKVFVSQPYNMNEKEVIPKDKITYSKCLIVTDGTIHE